MSCIHRQRAVRLRCRRERALEYRSEEQHDKNCVRQTAHFYVRRTSNTTGEYADRHPGTSCNSVKKHAKQSKKFSPLPFFVRFAQGEQFNFEMQAVSIIESQKQYERVHGMVSAFAVLSLTVALVMRGLAQKPTLRTQPKVRYKNATPDLSPK
jgi:hypothetical protein